ncbi:hypothetical protein IJI72_00190 [Candidatus Saccharibacteria bacterium]|nr:hypothetical protein [Candidatus Saccharibacteria bacterium]
MSEKSAEKNLAESASESTSGKSKSGSEKASKPLFSTETPPKMASPAILSAPVERPFPVFLAAVAGCVVCAALAVLFLVMMLSANARVSQLERDIEDYKSQILNLKKQINELDK